MNKNDIKLIVVVIFIALIVFLIVHLTKKEGNTIEVYYEDDLILTADININKEYKVEGALGEVIIEVKDKKVRVKKENSPKNICSKEGYISDSSRVLICLPNKITVKIVDKKNDIDGVIY